MRQGRYSKEAAAAVDDVEISKVPKGPGADYHAAPSMLIAVNPMLHVERTGC